MKKILFLTILIVVFLFGCGDAAIGQGVSATGNATFKPKADIVQIGETPRENKINLDELPFAACTTDAADWEIAVYVGAPLGDSLYAENKICIGQKDGATDGIDGYYEVPAFFMPDPDGGQAAIKAYVSLNEGQYWRDIRAKCGSEGPCRKIWPLHIEAVSEIPEIRVKWENAPTSLFLVDEVAGKAINMAEEQEHNSYSGKSSQEFKIVYGCD